MKNHTNSLRKATSIFLSVILAGLCCFIPVSADVTTVGYNSLSDFVIRSNVPAKRPTTTENGMVTSTGALKMQALDSAITYEEKTFNNF